MDKVYQHTNVEAKWQKIWQEKNIGQARGNGPAYSIVVPPPNVTGTLHMGHGFQLTIMDILIRYHRMSGYKTLWQVGTDHAGIATQMVVERQLAKDNITKHDLGREQFVERIWQWKQTSRDTITKQMQAMGTSMDWQRERFTLDENYSKKVKQVFIELYNKGLIYRGQKLVNWDPKLKTAVSDLEVINNERQGNLWHIRYELVTSPGNYIEIATTRPETLLADQAIAVHPDDERYQKLIGQEVKLPLTERTIPIIADEYVEPEFGSGCVKITPGHDFNDALVGKRHNLKVMNILNPDATLNELVPNKYQGLDRFIARKQILADLGDLLVKTEAHTHVVPVGDRSGEILEPLLTDQWFLNCDRLAESALEIVRSGQIEFVPEHWFNTYKHWLENIQDWCISRQLWWGHQIPAWYDDAGNTYVGTDPEAIRQEHKLAPDLELRQDEDVLDTWFSSALWPFVTLDWQQDAANFAEFYPSQVLVTGFDIIFFWVARMIMMGLECTDNIPFKQVYITGLIKDEKGQKMSKSKGNVLDPLDLINGISLDELITKRTSSMMQPEMAAAITKQTKKAFPDGIMPHGTDALRFTFAALASNGRDIRFDLNRLTGYRNFCNKLWNAARLVLNFDKPSANIKSQALSEVDKWLLARLQVCVNNCHTHIKSYRFDLLAKEIYEFTWNEYCALYLEWLKIVRSDQSIIIAHRVLGEILKLMHPIMPFITEEIWQELNPESECLALVKYPSSDATLDYDHSLIDDLFCLISKIRALRSELNINPKVELTIHIQELADSKVLELFAKQIGKLCNCRFSEQQSAAISATLVANRLQFAVPVAEFIEPSSEITRIEQVINKAKKLIAQAESRLNNEKYCENAPAEQVEDYRTQLLSAETTISTYNEHLILMHNLLKEQ